MIPLNEILELGNLLKQFKFESYNLLWANCQSKFKHRMQHCRVPIKRTPGLTARNLLPTLLNPASFYPSHALFSRVPVLYPLRLRIMSPVIKSKLGFKTQSLDVNAKWKALWHDLSLHVLMSFKTTYYVNSLHLYIRINVLASLHTLWVQHATSHSLCLTSAANFWQMSEEKKSNNYDKEQWLSTPK